MTFTRGKLIISGASVSFLLVYASTVFVFFSLTGDRLNRAGLLLAVVLFVLNLRSKTIYRTIPSLFMALTALALLVLSGNRGLRGFGAPIGHAYKFVYVFLIITISCIVSGYDQERKRRVVMLSLITFAITCVLSLFYVFTVSVFAIRYAGDLTPVYGLETTVSSFPLVAKFGQCYAAPLLLGCLTVLWMRAKHLKSRCSIILKLCFVVFLLFTGFSLLTSAMLLSVVGLLMAWLICIYTEKNYKLAGVVLLFVIAVSLMVIFRQQVSDALYRITEPLNWVIKDRLRYVFDKLLGTAHNFSEYAHEDRDYLVACSWNSFISHPILGVGYSRFGYGVIGSHHEWVDLLGTFGLVGVIGFLCVFGGYAIGLYKRIDSRTDRLAFLVCSFLFAILGFLNPCLSPSILFVLLVVAPNISSVLVDKRQISAGLY